MTLVFDAEPLVALLLDEPAADRVETLMRRVERGAEEGAVSRVNLAEATYIVARRSVPAARALMASLERWGLKAVPCEPAWQAAARLKVRHGGLSLGDAFAAATASALRGTLVLAADDDLERVCAEERIPVRRV